METKAREYFARLDKKVIPLNRNHSIIDEEQKAEMIAGGFGVTEESFSDCVVLIEKSAYEKLEAENKKLREALEFYASKGRHELGVAPQFIEVEDGKMTDKFGITARQALGEVEK